MIVCAAIKTHSGDIIPEWRHPDCIRLMAQSGRYKLPVTKDAVQGFLDSDGNFLDRVQARKLFLDSGQVSACGRMHPDLLFSEDLYAGPRPDNWTCPVKVRALLCT